MLSQNSIEENSIEENSIYTPSEAEASSGEPAKASKHKYGFYKHVLLKDEELQALQRDFSNWEELINYLDEYIEMKGYKAKSHYLCIRKWVVDAVKRNSPKKPPTKPTTSNKIEARDEIDYEQYYANL